MYARFLLWQAELYGDTDTTLAEMLAIRVVWDEALLERRISHLGLQLEGSEWQPCIRQLHEELTARGLAFLPPCHIGDEWFVPVGVPAIFIPFFLVHERLRRLDPQCGYPGESAANSSNDQDARAHQPSLPGSPLNGPARSGVTQPP